MKNKFLTIACAALMIGSVAANAAEDKPMPTYDRPTPEMMEAKLADRLHLNDDQRKAVRERRKKDQEEMRQLMDKMREIRNEMDRIRQENMQSFETLLTPEQKTEFDKIKAERQAHHMKRMEKRKMRHMKRMQEEMGGMPHMKRMHEPVIGEDNVTPQAPMSAAAINENDVQVTPPLKMPEPSPDQASVPMGEGTQSK